MPTDLQLLCRLCQGYADKMEFFETVAPSLTGFDIAEMQSLVHQIMSEHIKVVREFSQLGNEEVKKLEDDIAKNLSAFFDEKGRVRNLAPEFNLAKSGGVLDMRFALFMAPFTAFIDSRIYQSLSESLEKTRDFIIKSFTQSTLQKAGIYPNIIDPNSHLLPTRETHQGYGEEVQF